MNFLQFGIRLEHEKMWNPVNTCQIHCTVFAINAIHCFFIKPVKCICKILSIIMPMTMTMQIQYTSLSREKVPMLKMSASKKSTNSCLFFKLQLICLALMPRKLRHAIKLYSHAKLQNWSPPVTCVICTHHCPFCKFLSSTFYIISKKHHPWNNFQIPVISVLPTYFHT